MAQEIIVFKVGTSTLTHRSGLINIRRMEQLVKVLADLKNAGRQIILVSSGAVSVGVGKLGLKSRPEDIPGKQAVAAIGQCELMYLYDKMFAEYNHTVAQVLLTKDVTEDDYRSTNVKNTFSRLLEMNVIPVVNENDTVCTEEIEFGDNDALSAIVAQMVGADRLIIISDIDGLYTDNPKINPQARRLDVVPVINETILSYGKGAGSSRGTGGMETKVLAAQAACKAGIETVVLSGEDPRNLYRLFDGESIGTLFLKEA